MKHKVKTVVKVWWKYFVITYTLYGVSDALMHNVDAALTRLREKDNGEDPGEIIYEHLWFKIAKNFKKAGTMFIDYVNEKES